MIIIYILICIPALIVAGAIGFVIATYMDAKKLTEIRTMVEKLAKDYEATIIVSDDLISNLRKNIQEVYSKLVDLRDKEGVEDLDDVIGELGYILDDHKED